MERNLRVLHCCKFKRSLRRSAKAPLIPQVRRNIYDQRTKIRFDISGIKDSNSHSHSRYGSATFVF